MPTSNELHQQTSEKIKKPIKSIKITSSLLENAVKIIDKEISDIKNQNEREYCSITYTIQETDNRETESHDSNTFLKYELTQYLKRISIRLYSQEKKILIDLYIDDNVFDSYFTVEGRDSLWVNGIAKILEDVFENKKYKTYSNFFHSRKSCIVSIPIGIVIGLLLTMISGNQSFNPYTFLFFSLTVILNIHLWLFPNIYAKIETEYTKQAKFRKIIKYISSIICLPLVIGYIGYYLPH